MDKVIGILDTVHFREGVRLKEKLPIFTKFIWARWPSNPIREIVCVPVHHYRPVIT
jgi:hypothetical protein